jgi:hypothetical protein
VSYSAPAGDSWSRSLPLSDWGYDGKIDDDGVARGGLGILVDGVRGTGSSDFRPVGSRHNTNNKHRRLDPSVLHRDNKIDVEVVDGDEREENKPAAWVGWKNHSSPHHHALLARPGPVEIVLTFFGPRNFSALYLHMNNKFTDGVQVTLETVSVSFVYIFLSVFVSFIWVFVLFSVKADTVKPR